MLAGVKPQISELKVNCSFEENNMCPERTSRLFLSLLAEALLRMQRSRFITELPYESFTPAPFLFLDEA
jgi:hypothetical protein